MKFQESNFVDHIVSKLRDGNYLERLPKNLDLQRALDTELLEHQNLKKSDQAQFPGLCFSLPFQ